jgi:outer membrane receptor protein involved in Fe transport
MHPFLRDRRGLLVLTLAAGASLAAAEPKSTPTSPTDEEREKVVTLSPFEVVSDNNGYYQSNTMSGTRLNSKIEDLGASITVVTKQQMQDLALLDLNDIFSYEAGTEGTRNYTSISFERDGNNITDNVERNPQGANRIRGVGAANITFGNFAGSGRVPIDPINIDAVEISRGPNANIFGIGNASGSVNSVPASANLLKAKSQFAVRVDDREGFRTTVDLNRVLKPGVLAVRGSTVFQRDAYVLKPSGTDTTRYNGMVKFRPFKTTTLSASYTHYKMHGNRPNSITPVDGISAWKAAGSPTWDPITFTAKIDGRSVGVFPGATSATTTPVVFNNLASQNASLIFVDRDGIKYWTTSRATNSNNPASGNQSMILMSSSPAQVRATQPLFSNNPTVTDRAIYDWMKINVSAPNYYEDRAQISTVSLEQLVFETRRQSLAGQLSWYRESNERLSINTISQSPYGNIGVGGIAVDVNERLLDGSTNPYFLRPFIASANPYTRSEPRDQDIYRVQLAYKLDFRADKNWQRWLGMHQVSSYADYSHTVGRSIRYLDVITSNNPWIPAGIARASTGAYGGLLTSNNTIRPYYRFYVGDNQGQNIDYAPSNYQRGDYTLVWGNGQTGQFNREPVTLGRAVEGVSTGQGQNTETILKSRGIILQSHLANDRVVTTFGLRHDQRFSRNGGLIRYLPDGIDIDEASFYAWGPDDWAMGKGPTRTAGAVVRPLRWLSVHANRSDSFQPASPALNLDLKRLPDPAGKGEDYGFTLTLFDNKFVLRANQYSTKVLGTRAGTAGTIATRILFVDRPNVQGQNGSPAVYQLQPKAAQWATDAAAAVGRTLTPAQLKTETARIMGVSEDFLDPFQYQVTATNDQIAKGREVELNYNPTPHWTMKLNVTEQQSIDANLAPEVSRWLAARIAHWKTIIDPTINRPWYTERYNNSTPASDFIAVNASSALALAQATEGKSRPQIRKYRANLSSNLRLAGVSSNPIVKRFNVGGALRWEDKAAIGYYGVEQFPAVVTALDPNRPVYDKPNLYVDAFVGYRTRLFSDKVSATFQLNVRNLTEDGRLQKINAYPDGTASAFRIVERRQFILSATFDL